MCGQSAIAKRAWRHTMGESSSNSVYFVKLFPVLCSMVVNFLPSRDASIL